MRIIIKKARSHCPLRESNKDTGHIALDNDKMYEDSKGAIWNLSSALKSLHDYATYIKRNIIKGKDADVGRKSFKEIT